MVAVGLGARVGAMMAVGGGASSAVGEEVATTVAGMEVCGLLQEVSKRQNNGKAMTGFMLFCNAPMTGSYACPSE